MTRRKRGFGQVRRLPSKRWQAFYTGPDTALHYAPSTFEAKEDAESWLTDERRIIASGNWMPPKDRKAAELAGLPPTFEDYAKGWMRSRTLKPHTRALYQRLLDRHILPELGHLRLDMITPTTVRTWHTKLGPGA